MGHPSMVKQVNDSLQVLNKIGKPKKKNKKDFIYHGRTMKNYISHCCDFALWAKSTYGIKRLANLDTRMGLQYLNYLYDKGCSPYTIQNAYSALRKLEKGIKYKYKHSTKIVTGLNLKLPKRKLDDRQGRQAYTQKELKQIIDRSARIDQEASYAMEVQALCGLRISEVLKLKKTDIHLFRDVLVVWRGKGGLQRDVTIPKEDKYTRELLEMLGTDKEEMDYLFPGLNEKKLRDTLIKTCRELGIEHHKTHNLRHTYASNLYKKLRDDGLEDNKTRLKVAKQLGHNRTDVTCYYVPRKQPGSFL